MSSSTLLGVVLLVRHGDRMGFYQDPDTYSPSATQITPLGNQEEYQLGAYLRSLYLNASSPSYVGGISTGLFEQGQVTVRADLGGESGVVYDSCVALTQGLWPATTGNNVTLANGSTIVAPLGGYQYVPIDGVDPNLDVSLEGFEDCNTFDEHTLAFYDSAVFKQMASRSEPFLSLLPPYLGGRPATLRNMWNIYDFMNVNNIHNATFAQSLPPTFLAQARALANWHEHSVFTDADPGGIGNVAGQTMVPSLLAALGAIADAANPTKLFITALAYKPFLSLFQMTGVTAAQPELAGIVDYASVVALEIRQATADSAPVVRLNFKNGSDAALQTYAWMNTTGDVPLQTLVDALGPAAVNGTAAWCRVCRNTQDRGCAALSLAAAQARAAALAPVGPLGAGFLGAGLTFAVCAAALAALAVLGCLTCAPRFRRRGAAAYAARRAADVGANDQVELNKTRTGSQST